MVDFGSYVQHGPSESIPIGELTLADEDEDDECRCAVCMADGGPKDNQKYDWDANDGTKENFCREQYLICPPRVLGYHLMEKKWVELRVDRVQDIEKRQMTNAFDKLQLTQKKKDLIRELVWSHTNDKIMEMSSPRSKMNDLTKGKGEGLVILLHGMSNWRPWLMASANDPIGPPGVGKTLTAGKNVVSLYADIAALRFSQKVLPR